LKTKIPLRRALKKHVGYLHDEKEDPLTANPRGRGVTM
jgi:hypothetical protein